MISNFSKGSNYSDLSVATAEFFKIARANNQKNEISEEDSSLSSMEDKEENSNLSDDLSCESGSEDSGSDLS